MISDLDMLGPIMKLRVLYKLHSSLIINANDLQFVLFASDSAIEPLNPYGFFACLGYCHIFGFGCYSSLFLRLPAPARINTNPEADFRVLGSLPQSESLYPMSSNVPKPVPMPLPT